jgi:hypothetical protein
VGLVVEGMKGRAVVVVVVVMVVGLWFIYRVTVNNSGLAGALCHGFLAMSVLSDPLKRG